MNLPLMTRLFAIAFLLAIAGDRAIAAPPDSTGSTLYGYSTHPQTADTLGLVPAGAEATFVEPQSLNEGSETRATEPFNQAPPLAPVVQPTFDPAKYGSTPPCQPFDWHLLPNDVLFRSFIAGVHAPRMSGEIVTSSDEGALLDVAMGSRISIVRHGTIGPHSEGWELQVYGGAFARLAMEQESDVVGTDYIFGVPIVWRRGPTAFRIGYDHISSHVGDEFLLKNPTFQRLNYVRDSIEFAVIEDLTEDVSVYGEVNYALSESGGSQPLHLQFGAEYEPFVPAGFRGAPVVAINTLLREEFDFEGSLGVVAGWQWRGVRSQDLLRLGLTLYTGPSRQFSFYDKYEKLFGVGLWYDF